jgi:hydroxyacylglutathione hydrolase
MVKVFRFDEEKEFSANTYVLGKVGGNCLVIDLGSTSPSVYKYIDTHYERCVGILLTHGHFDHIRGIAAFQKHFHDWDIPVYLNEKDIPLLSDPRLNSSDLMGDNVRTKIDTIAVQDGEELVIHDFHIKVIATPFHTDGSVCYLLNDDNALFTGDTLFKGSIGRTDLPTSHPELVPSSLKKIAALKDTLVLYPGHGDLTRLSIEKATNPFLKGL